MSKKVTILGAGNGGHALAYDLCSHDREVMLFEHPDFAKSLDGIKQSGGIEAVSELKLESGESMPGTMPGFAKVTNLTTDPKEAIEFADTIAMIVPSFAQESVFKMVMPYLRDGMTFLIMPGNFASLIFTKMMREAGIKKDITWIEGASIPYAVRIIAPGKIFMLAKKSEFQIGVFPGFKTAEVKDNLHAATMKLSTYDNVLGAGMSNANMIIHTPTATLGMGPMESREGKIQFYAEGASDTVCKVLEAMDKERLATAKGYGLELMSFTEEVNSFYSLNMKNIRDFTKNTPYHNKIPNDAPKSPKERYISEDCPYVCVPVYEFGKLAGASVSTIESIIRIDSIYNDTDYFKTGRTLEKIGFAGMDVAQILEHVNKGE